MPVTLVMTRRSELINSSLAETGDWYMTQAHAILKIRQNILHFSYEAGLYAYTSLWRHCQRWCRTDLIHTSFTSRRACSRGSQALRYADGYQQSTRGARGKCRY